MCGRQTGSISTIKGACTATSMKASLLPSLLALDASCAWDQLASLVSAAWPLPWPCLRVSPIGRLPVFCNLSFEILVDAAPAVHARLAGANHEKEGGIVVKRPPVPCSNEGEGLGLEYEGALHCGREPVLLAPIGTRGGLGKPGSTVGQLGSQVPVHAGSGQEAESAGTRSQAYFGACTVRAREE